MNPAFRPQPGTLDPGLVDACRRGERAALDKLFRVEMPALVRLLRRLVWAPHDVEDLLEMTFVAAIDAFPRYRGEASVRRWLACIAVRIVHEHLRRPERRRRVSLELLVSTPLEPRDRAPAPDRAIETQRRMDRLYHHLDAIDPKKRIPFVLHVFEGRPIDEVAAMVGASVAATKTRIFWARRTLLARAKKDPKLRELLDDGGSAS